MPDPETARELGTLQERVRGLDSKFGNLESKIDNLSSKIDSLSAVAERGKGAYFAALGIASFIGAAVTWFAKHFSSAPTP